MANDELAAAKKRAQNWKKKPLRSNKAKVMVNGKREWRDIYSVKPIDPAMAPYITQDEIDAAGREAMALNPR